MALTVSSRSSIGPPASACALRRSALIELLELTHDALILARSEGEIVALNERAELLLGWTSAEALGHSVLEVLDLRGNAGCTIPTLRGELALERLRMGKDVAISRRDGTQFTAHVRAAIVREPADATIEWQVFALQRVSRMIEDRLEGAETALPDRTAMLHALQQTARATGTAPSRNAVACIAIDQLAAVNRSAGRTVGEAVLDLAIGALSRTLTDRDYLARIDGDGFAVLYVDTDLDTAESRVRTGMQQFAIALSSRLSEQTSASLSAGVVALNDDTVDVASILAEAETACRQAQADGGNRILTMRTESSTRQRRRVELSWMAQLSHALDTDAIDITVEKLAVLDGERRYPAHYDVQMKLRDEAGDAPPVDRLLAIAERFSLRAPVDRWLVSTLLPRIAPQSGAADSVFIVGLSGQSIAEAGALAFLRRRVVESGVDARRIVFRVTETAALARPVATTRLFAGLHQLGCGLMVDQVGSGQSSFAYLKSLPLRYVALDAALTRSARSERTDRAMVEAVQRLCDVLDISTVAYGVTSTDELQLLREIGIDFAGGALIDTPKPLS